MPTALQRTAGGALAPGSALGRYEILRRIASGGMATVHLARAHGLGGFRRLVAAKVCHPHLREDPKFAAMFLDEARLAAQIHHPNVVATLDVDDDDGVLYLVMEYVEGGCLAALITAADAAGARVPVPIALRILVDALAGLDAAHRLRGDDGRALNLVHRDISPQNVLVGFDGIARVTDFGVAKAEARAVITREGELRGKLGYMPPEQLLQHEVSPRGDIYAAGVVLWETLTGWRLFRGATNADLVAAVLAGSPSPPSEHAPEVPPALDAVVLRALARDPRERFATAAAFAEALEACGVVPATPRALGAYVEQVLGPSTAHRADLEADAPASGPATPGEFTGVATRTVVQPVPANDTARTDPAPVAQRGRGRAVALGLALLVGAVALVAGTHHATPTVAAAPVTAAAPRHDAPAAVTPVPATTTAAPSTLAAPAIAAAPGVAATRSASRGHAPARPPVAHREHARSRPGASPAHPSLVGYSPGSV